VDVLQIARELSGLSAAALFALALLTGAMGWWGFSWTHKAALALKDDLIALITLDRDYWRAQALKAAELNAKWADQNEQLTGILEAMTKKAGVA
jgi:hypothetical protein